MRLRGSWHLVGLLAVAIALGLAAVIELGPPTSSARTSREVVTAAQGVVQSTVTGTGNVEPSTDVEANFQTSGTLQHVYIAAGTYVLKGELIATLDPSSAQSTVDQAQESLTAAQDQLANAESATVTTSSSSDDTGTGGTSTAEDTALELPAEATTTVTVTAPQRTTTAPTRTTTTPTRTTTTPTRTTTTPTRTTTTPTRTATTGGSGSSGSGSSGSGSQSSSGSSGANSSGESADTKAANIASAEASVDSAEASLTNAERALNETKLYSPATGTVVSVQAISPGDAVSGATNSSASDSGSDDSGSSGTGSSATGTGSSATTSAGSLGSSSDSSSSSSTSTGFAEIINTHTMTMTVAFSESDISKVKVGQPATVTLEALTGVELGAHVTSISTLGTTSDSVVSYDATLTLDQRDSQVKPGMSASAAVITGQARGVTLPNSAVSSRGATSTVQELRNGKTVSTPVIVGVQGDTRTQIVSGLSAGAEVVVTETLPSLGASSTGSSTSSGTLGATGLGGGGFGGGAGGFGGGAGFARRFGGG